MITEPGHSRLVETDSRHLVTRSLHSSPCRANARSVACSLSRFEIPAAARKFCGGLFGLCIPVHRRRSHFRVPDRGTSGGGGTRWSSIEYTLLAVTVIS